MVVTTSPQNTVSHGDMIVVLGNQLELTTACNAQQLCNPHLQAFLPDFPESQWRSWQGRSQITRVSLVHSPPVILHSHCSDNLHPSMNSSQASLYLPCILIQYTSVHPPWDLPHLPHTAFILPELAIPLLHPWAHSPSLSVPPFPSHTPSYCASLAHSPYLLWDSRHLSCHLYNLSDSCCVCPTSPYPTLFSPLRAATILSFTKFHYCATLVQPPAQPCTPSPPLRAALPAYWLDCKPPRTCNLLSVSPLTLVMGSHQEFGRRSSPNTMIQLTTAVGTEETVVSKWRSSTLWSSCLATKIIVPIAIITRGLNILMPYQKPTEFEPWRSLQGCYSIGQVVHRRRHQTTLTIKCFPKEYGFSEDDLIFVLS